MNGLQTLPQWRQYFGNPEGALLGLMNSVYPLGKVVSMFVVSYLCDRWGRKLPIIIGLVTCIAFAILQGLSNNLHSFIIARAFLGFFTSFLSQPSPIIVAELAYPTQRGKITALYNTFFVSSLSPWALVNQREMLRLTRPQYFGAIFAAWCTFGTFKIESTWSWRIPSHLQGAIPFCQLLGVFFLPESPRFVYVSPVVISGPNNH